MDQSIITQVARDDRAPAASAGSTSTNGGHSEAFGGNERDEDGQAESDHSASAPSRGRPGLLSSILSCGCFACIARRGGGSDAQRLGGSASDGTNGPNTNIHLPSITSPPPSVTQNYLIGDARTEDLNKKCIVIDLDETLVHSSFTPVPNADFVIPVEIEGVIHQVYVLKRPFVDQFLKRMGELFECVLFTASLAKYADPVTDLLDRTGCFRHRLFRESCVFHRGNYVKDLSRIGRDVNNMVIIDNSPACYIFQPDNAVPVGSWFDDPNDTELLELIPFFEGLTQVESCVEVLRQSYNSSWAMDESS